MGCHDNHAFSHSPNMFIFEEHFYRMLCIPGNSLAQMHNRPVGGER